MGNPKKMSDVIKAKILIVGQLPPPFHGSNVMAEIMVNSLKSKGYRVVFVDKNFSKSIRTIGKLTLKKIFRIPVLGFEILIKSLLIKPSLCIYFPAVGKPAFLLDAIYLFIIRKCKIPYVLRFGGKGYRLLQKEGSFWNKVVGDTLSNAFGGIVLGNNMKWDVNTHINEKRLINVPNGVPVPAIKQCLSNDGKIRILYLSNLHPTKGPLEVLKAAKIVIEKKKNILFILAGSVSSKFFKEELHPYVADNGLENFISFPGGVHGKQKEFLFNSSNIFVFPTYFEKEVFGTVNIEAMSYGLPVISSSEGAIPEIVQDGKTGFIVNPKSPEEIAEKILLLVNNSSLCKTMGKQAKKVFEQKYTLKSHADNLDRAISHFLKLAHEDKSNIISD
jgi:glycosyltransferase involved in cell wall biosynthesis